MPTGFVTRVLPAILLLLTVDRLYSAEAVVLNNGARIAGEILEWDERGLNIRLESQREVRYPLSDIKKVEAQRSPAHLEGSDALSRRDDEKAIAAFQKALTAEKRSWAVHQIRTGLIKAFRRKGQLDEAARIFLPIFEDRKDVDVLLLAPLVWTKDENISDSSLTLAKQWLTDSKPIAKLLAASWLLNSTPTGDPRTVLDELQTVDQRVGLLARAQLWRNLPEKASNDQLARMKSAIDKMPSIIRTGPQFAYASALAQAGQDKEAALAFLWISYVYDPGSDLAAEALLQGGLASKRAGFDKDAEKILKEVVQVYPGSNWATKAQNELAGLPNKGKPNG